MIRNLIHNILFNNSLYLTTLFYWYNKMASYNAHSFASGPATNEYKKIFCAYHTTEFLTNFCM